VTTSRNLRPPAAAGQTIATAILKLLLRVTCRADKATGTGRGQEPETGAGISTALVPHGGVSIFHAGAAVRGRRRHGRTLAVQGATDRDNIKVASGRGSRARTWGFVTSRGGGLLRRPGRAGKKTAHVTKTSGPVDSFCCECSSWLVQMRNFESWIFFQRADLVPKLFMCTQDVVLRYRSPESRAALLS